MQFEFGPNDGHFFAKADFVKLNPDFNDKEMEFQWRRLLITRARETFDFVDKHLNKLKSALDKNTADNIFDDGIAARQLRRGTRDTDKLRAAADSVNVTEKFSLHEKFLNPVEPMSTILPHKMIVGGKSYLWNNGMYFLEVA